jgi:ubiquinone biosynthesis UbiH/UbiF/VisC/COQ6 family hydroxylase
MKKDIIIIGAGPAGLSFARSLADTELKIVIIEKLAEDILADPPVDGREIALTHLSKNLMTDLGAWDRIPADEISMIKEAKVLDGDSPYALHFDRADAGEETLGYMVSNHLIRKSFYEEVKELDNVELICEASVESVDSDSGGASVTLSNGEVIDASLVVAADSRFSGSRRAMGISASMLDFGRVCIVCRMKHKRSHNETAYECFNYGGTLAVLPMNGNMSSIVITVSSEKAEEILAMDDEEFAEDVRDKFDNKLGEMELVGKRFSYPLVAVYARKFFTTRFALVGDAAVGMHPVTAHGWNLGLRGADALANEIKDALAHGGDIGADSVLESYQTKHRKVSKPIYMGTNAVVKLFTDERKVPKLLRKAVLRIGNRFPPGKRAITNLLTEVR